MRNVEFNVAMGSEELNEFRRLLGWARLFALGAFVALSGLASFVVGGRPAWAVVVTVAGAGIAALAWPKIRPFASDAGVKSASVVLSSPAA